MTTSNETVAGGSEQAQKMIASLEQIKILIKSIHLSKKYSIINI